MSDRINDITIVGGGDSGLLAALAIRQLNPEIDVSVVDDFGGSIPQVGKSTFLEIRNILHANLEIDEHRFISEVRPVWKATVYFRDWCDDPPFHYPFDAGMRFPGSQTENAVDHYYHYYDELHADPDHRTMCEELVEQGKSPWHFNARQGSYDKYNRTAYHLNTERFNTFLRTLCRERDVSLIDDEITTVETSGNRVDRVRSKSQSYEADLYVDASGFNRVIKSNLDGEFVDFDFPLDSAYNTRVDRPLSEVEPATVIETGDYGWFWQIDTTDNRDLGYVYASEYVSDEAALSEFEEFVGEPLSAEEVGHYEFSSGYHAPAWEGNCIAIGNAEGFVEPLQSTGLTVNAKAAVKLSKLLSIHGRIPDAIRESYNAWVHESWESTYDFISVHYKFASGDNEFWEDVRSLDVSPRVEHLIEEFDRNGMDRTTDPTARSDEYADLEVFNHMDFYVIMRDMGATSAFYEDNHFDVSEDLKREKEEQQQSRADRVDGFLSTEEMYKTVIDQ